ncbi:MFS transporter [Burkholderia multivorans]|uniref:MFS transporter n=1 Tax=Burkholderia multivorans TaxID=87883 RepID=UPI0005B7EEB7|nr:MFS transporter [Burkholderia multivorans]MBJ9658861.1 MFS transporter [Burkholderia multivorans]MBR8048803.1 MFS transporter [Burkholderia multivorans]MBU9471704.1 MFS transporter [Burkholderia multivorans]PRH47244.1 MFS transporter [Burkholderia multivorans]
MDSSITSRWDTAYEWKAVVLLSLGFGLVGVDRFMIMPLFPVMMKDLHLDYQDLGYITGALSVAWGFSAMLMGNLSDRVGHRKVVIPAIVMFSLLAGLSGLATGLGTLILIRAVMGLAEGAFTPASIIATLDASKPSRHGRNVGIQQMALPLFGLGLAPILVTQLLKFMPWHSIFAIVSIPGLVVALLLWKVLRNTKASSAAVHTMTHDATEHKWSDVFRYRNIRLNIVGMLCWLTCLVVLTALLPNYLVDYLHLDMQQMGYVLSAIGFGGMLGTVTMPSLSDRLGRKPVMILSVIGAAVFLTLLARTGANPTALFFYLMLTLLFVFSMITLTVGPLSAESVPAKLMSTASGLVVGVGEVFGGGIAPAIAGYVAKHFGIQYIMTLGFIALAVGFIVAASLKETAPSRATRQASVTAQ